MSGLGGALKPPPPPGVVHPGIRASHPPSGQPQRGPASPLGSGILIVEFQAYIVFAIYRMSFEADIAQISLRLANIAICRDICLRKLRQISIFHIAISIPEAKPIHRSIAALTHAPQPAKLRRRSPRHLHRPRSLRVRVQRYSPLPFLRRDHHPTLGQAALPAAQY